MKFTHRVILCMVSFSILARSAWAQCPAVSTINFVNPSFEGTPATPNVTPAPWTECMPGQTPDTQPGCWGVTLAPANGNSYLGLVAEPAGNWQEGAAEQLGAPFSAGVTYTFTVDLANSSTTGGGIVPGCAECQIWGGFSACDKNTLLWSSANITPYDTWKLYTVTFTPTQSFTWCMFQVHSLGCSSEPYILVDNISPITTSNVTVAMQPVSDDKCAGDSTGQAIVHAHGTHAPFTYAWNTPLITSDSVLNNVPAGTYTVTVTDANTCTASASIAITQPAAIALTTATITNTSCFGGNNGGVNVTGTGGVSPLTYHWSNGATTGIIAAVSAGNYILTATDANSCTATVNATVSQPNALAITGNITNANCSVNNGSVAASVTGGTGTCTYSWNTVPVQNTATATGLAPGIYIIVVTDGNSCTADQSFTVTQPPNTLAGNIAVTNVLCFGQSTGALSAVISGGNPAYTYAWSNSGASVSINNLAIGSYSVTVHDAIGCVYVLDTAVTQPASPISATAAETDVLCFGQNTGSTSVTAGGGTAGYTYNWNSNPAQTTMSATNLYAGSYTVTVTDANQCTFTANTTVNQPAAGLSVTENHVDILCFGAATGSAIVTASGGTTPYTYNWSNGQTSSAISVLIAGTYTVSVVDANQCPATISSIITQPAAPLQVTDSLVEPICFGETPASATALANGGVPGAGYAYAWNTAPVQNTQTITSVPAGTFTVTVTDANNCTATAAITVTSPTPITITTHAVNVLCFGNSTGSIAAIAVGSYGSYSYVWSTAPAQLTSTAQQLPSGAYSLTVTDLNGCTAIVQDTVTQPAAPLSLMPSHTDVLCFGFTTGTAGVTVNGGTSPYSYVWNTHQNTATITSLPAGYYNVTVTDANGCIDISGADIIQPAGPLQDSIAITNILCNGYSTGSIDVTVTGGTAGYSYQWGPGTTATADNTNIPAGSYSMTVTDANSCTLLLSNMVVTQPTALALATQVTNVSCPHHGDGKINAFVSGAVPPYTYTWNNGQATATDTLLNGGSYNLLVTDNNGCTIADNNILVTELPGVSIEASVTNILCFPLKNGAIDINASSSFIPLTYAWNTGAASPNLSDIDTGLYSITVTDAHNCIADTSLHVGNDSMFTMAVTPDTITVKLGQFVNIEATAFGSSFSTISWSPSVALSCSDCADPVASPLTSITYYVATTDPHGCTATDEVQITVIPFYDIYIPNVFTPNGDGKNDYFEVYGNKEAWKYFSIEIFDRWGEKVLESDDMNFKWDGEYKGRPAQQGVYVYEAHLVFIDDHTEKLFKGSITLIR